MTIITKRNKADIKTCIWAIEWEIKQIQQTLDMCDIKEKSLFCYDNINSLTKLLGSELRKIEAYL